MKNKLLVSINNLEDIEGYEKIGVNSFLFPLTDFSVGFPNTFSLEDIPNGKNSYVLINRILDCKSVDNLKKLLKKVNNNIKGIIFEDLAVLNIAKEFKLSKELIWWGSHFGTNHEMINFFLDKGIDSVFISGELTKDEIASVAKRTIKPSIAQLFGYTQCMYSRRELLSNYMNYYNLDLKKELIIKDEKDPNLEFKVFENDYGTVVFDNHIFDGRELMNIPNIKYFYINTSFLSKDIVLEVLKNIDKMDFNLDLLNIKTSKGFLDKKTIYKLPGGEK